MSNQELGKRAGASWCFGSQLLVDPERFENGGIILISHNTAGVQLILLVVKKFKQVDPTNSSGCSSVLFGLGHIPLRLCHTVLCSKMGEIEELLSSLLREKGSISRTVSCWGLGLPPAVLCRHWAPFSWISSSPRARGEGETRLCAWMGTTAQGR